MGEVVAMNDIAIDCMQVLAMKEGPDKYEAYNVNIQKHGVMFKGYYEFFQQKQQEESPEWITVNKSGKQVLNTSLLAEHIRRNSYYYIVSKQGSETQFIFWYTEGYYKQIAPSELKAKIKELIPLEIRKPSQWEDVYRDLMTTDNYRTYEQMNGEKEQRFINFKNGMLSIDTLELLDHSPGYKHIFQVPYRFNEKAKTPVTWFNYLDTLTNGDKAMQNTLQEWAGLNLSNFNANICKKAVALFGETGNTGKTKFISVLNKMIGQENVSSIPIQDLCERFASGGLYGKKALIIDDQKGDSIQNGSIFKSITGMGPINAELKGKQPFTFTFTGGITFTCNNMPYIKDDKGGHMFDRFLIIPCDNVIPEAKRDKRLLEKLEAEMEGIILWAIYGLVRLMENNFTLTVSEASKEANDKYRALNDTLYSFLNEYYEITGNSKDRISKVDFETRYEKYCIEAGHKALDKKNIQKRAILNGLTFGKVDGYFHYKGLKLK